jgi:hypothetical protein
VSGNIGAGRAGGALDEPPCIQEQWHGREQQPIDDHRHGGQPHSAGSGAVPAFGPIEREVDIAVRLARPLRGLQGTPKFRVPMTRSSAISRRSPGIPVMPGLGTG